MSTIYISEIQFRQFFREKVSPDNYSFMLKKLKEYGLMFSEPLFDVFSEALDQKKLKKVLDCFKKKVKNQDDMRINIIEAMIILGH